MVSVCGRDAQGHLSDNTGFICGRSFIPMLNWKFGTECLVLRQNSESKVVLRSEVRGLFIILGDG